MFSFRLTFLDIQVEVRFTPALWGVRAPGGHTQPGGVSEVFRNTAGIF